MSAFTHLTRARAMRRLLVNGGMWGAYGQLVVVSGPIFTGFALWMGLEAADIALIASVAALAGLVQPLSSFLTGKLRNQKSFVIRFGLVEITLTTGVALIPLVFRLPAARFAFAAVAVLTGTFTGNLVAPLFNSWFSTVLPEEARARFMGRRLVLVNLAAMAAGYGAGQFIDLTGGGYISFVVPYATAWLVGVTGYWVLVKIPFPAILRSDVEITFNRALITPFRNRRFRNLLIFYLAWVFGVLMADPFYNVFMIRDLKISYATIGVFNAIVLGVGILGYWTWGAVAARFGNKPVLQLLLIPRLLLPFVWVLLTPRNSGVLLYVIMALNGVVFSGLTVAINTLLFGSVPDEGDRAGFFAVWAFSASLVTAFATAIGGFIVRNLSEVTLHIAGIEVEGIRITFLLSGILMIVPVILLRWVDESNAKPVSHILGQVLRGNPVGFVYNAFLFSRYRGSRARARAARAMGRSKNPMAVERLVKAIDDVDPDVREQAVKGLGETGSEDAVMHLAAALADEESDVRIEAAESIGKIRHPSGIDPLFVALDSDDARVAISAARALGDIGGEAVVERLWEKLVSNPGKSLFVSLVESASRLGDLRIAKPAVEAIDDYTSPVVRLQLLNAVCRVFGARNLFYELLSKDGYELAERLDQMLTTMSRRLAKRRKPNALDPAGRHAMLQQALVEGRYADFPGLAAAVAESLDLIEPEARIAAECLRAFASRPGRSDTERAEIFAVVCLGTIVDTLPA